MYVSRRFRALKRIALFLTLPFACAIFYACSPLQTELSANDPAILTLRDAAKLKIARDMGLDAVQVLVVSEIRENASNANLISDAGGRVLLRYDDVDSIVAIIPRRNINALFLELGASAVSVDIPLDRDVLRKKLYGPPLEWTVDGLTEKASTPKVYRRHLRVDLDNKASILGDLNAEEQFGVRSPYDGRGVVIAHVEHLPDFLIPELQMALNEFGEHIPKFRDVVTVPDHAYALAAEDDVLDKRWVPLSAPIDSNRLVASHRGNVYAVPTEGTYRFGEATFPAYVNRDALGVSGDDQADRMLLLWSDSQRRLWIDQDSDRSFSDETAVPLFKDSQTFGILGKDDPTTPERESIAFALQYDESRQCLVLDLGFGLGSFTHATSVAAAMAGNNEHDGAHVSGTAPAAQIFLVARGRSLASFVQGLVTAFESPDTDIVMIQGYSPVVSTVSAVAGHSGLTVLLERLIDWHDKPALVTATNASGMSTVSDIAEARNAIAVGNYSSRETTLTNLGIDQERADAVATAGAAGPSLNGAAKPDVIAPSTVIVPTARTRGALDIAERLQEKQRVRLPQGFYVGGGTSISTPTAAGALARLMSAAKQEGISYDARRLTKALVFGARYLEDPPAYRQGNGVIDLDRSWRNLLALNESPSIEISVKAPIRTKTSHLRRPANIGHGLFEREGWRAGDTGKRTIVLERTTGPEEAMQYQIEWLGNAAGTYSSVATIDLPLRKPVRLDVHIQPGVSGVHSSLLTIRGVDGLTVKSITATIIAADRLSSENDYSLEKAIACPPLGQTSIFFYAPFGVASMALTFQGSDVDRIDLYTPTAELAAQHVFDWENSDSSLSLNIVSPMEGVWEAVFLCGSTTSHAAMTAYRSNVQSDALFGIRAPVPKLTRGYEARWIY